MKSLFRLLPLVAALHSTAATHSHTPTGQSILPAAEEDLCRSVGNMVELVCCFCRHDNRSVREDCVAGKPKNGPYCPCVDLAITLTFFSLELHVCLKHFPSSPLPPPVLAPDSPSERMAASRHKFPRRFGPERLVVRPFSCCAISRSFRSSRDCSILCAGRSSRSC